tara:strand:+ start:1769 stop:3838 length:2070 start_codon:yes stop_codon:yes gene_type:complete
MLTPIAAPMAMESTTESHAGEEPWWETTNMDQDRDRIHDAVWMAVAGMSGGDWVDENGRIGVIIDFDHTPIAEDEILLSESVDIVISWRYHLIDSIAGRIAVGDLFDVLDVPGVVFVELDGRLEVQMEDVVPYHGVDTVWDDTGYTGAGSVVAIIDTGIDSDHAGLDDLDDRNETNDPKVIAFYDPVNTPDLSNGTEVKAYDDQGHGTHCAGITAGTGAPDMVHVGVAPQAQLVGVKVLDSGGSGSFSTVMAGMEWTVDKKHVFNIRAASMSLGGPGAIEWTSSEEESVNRMGNRMMAEGIALFIAAGNNAVSAQIGTPGSAEDVITVGALDKSGSIAVYSSQGPTEEGRIKPNIAFIGSNVNAPDYNTGTGYVSLSGTSMATPGAAGLAALMYQANPDMSPFDVRNIMQETAIYRPCHYDFANEPCAEDLIPKNRQNNVYGHGETRAPESVAEAANYVFGLDMGMNISLQSEPTMDDKVHVGPGEGIDYSLTGDPVEVQWRTWDMRDTWMDLVEHDMGEEEVTITHTMLVDRLNELPDVEIEGNHTILLRSIRGPNASANMVTHIHVMGSEPLIEVEGGSGQGMVAALSFVVLLLAGVIGLLMFILYRNSTLDSNHRIGDFSAKVQDSSSPDANLLDTFQTKLNNSQTSSVADYASMTVAELKDVLKSKGLPFSGRKAELIERLTNEK